MKLPGITSAFRYSVLGITSICVAACLLPAGCRTLDDILNYPPPDGGSGDGDTPQPTPDADIVLQLANLTDDAVDTELFITTNATSNALDELFVEENRLTDAIGIAATGLLGPLSSDEVELPCTEEFTIGTAGGSFLDQETGDLLGTGTVRVLQRGLVLDCGDKITLLYRREGTGYAVDIMLE